MLRDEIAPRPGRGRLGTVSLRHLRSAMSIPDEYPIASGDVLLGKYRVEKVLGRGAMGLVVAARHLTLDERVAIKLLLPKCAQDAQMVQRFLREARAAVRIRSQH